MAYYPHDSSYLSRRGLAFLGIVILHVFLIWGFAKGFAREGVRYVQTILQTNIIQTEKPPVQVIAPDINISVPVEAPPPIQNQTTQKVEAPPPAPRAIVPGTPIKAVSGPDIADYYPDSSRRAGEQGRAIIKVCVDPKGKIESAELATTSGFPALDVAAVKYAKAMKFKPGTSEGKPVTMCATQPVKFELH
jgi:protein TonB